MTKQIMSGSNGSGTVTVQQRQAGTKQNSTRQTIPSQNQIATRAYEIWQENGCRHGRDQLDWLQAERELIQRLKQN